MIVISSCLAGIPCRYDGTARENAEAAALAAAGKAVCACPERLAGLKSPRPPAEIRGGDGNDVWNGRARVYNRDGKDLTELFKFGARRFLEYAQKQGANCVMLKAKSPSCGVHCVYDGTFSGKLRSGCGVTAALLQQNGIKVVELP